MQQPTYLQDLMKKIKRILANLAYLLGRVLDEKIAIELLRKIIDNFVEGWLYKTTS